MNSGRAKRRPLRVGAEGYRQLRHAVLERDGWRCQSCGVSRNLEVHHNQSRSHSGEDSKENLITLCSDCHSRCHSA